tara:strand:- start:22065 stop:23093 length:1029 start_codon:yes stop_codon:yes gene_type:complete
MGFFKRYPIFCSVLALLVLVLGAGVYLVIAKRAESADAQKGYENQVRRLNEISRGVLYDPETGLRIAPSSMNREVLAVRLGQVEGDLNRIRENMIARSDNILNDPADEFTFLPKLQSSIEDLKLEARQKGVVLPEDEAFGFAAYATQAIQPRNAQIPLLNRQRQVIQYIVGELIAAEPSAILSVERELIEVDPADLPKRGKNAKQDDVFTIEELVTARSNEFIETSAFRLVFTGRTDVLRNFLNTLNEFKLPLVVRSVEVEPGPPEEEPKAEAKPSGSSDDALLALFGSGGSSSESQEVAEEEDESRKPVITENLSKFTIVIEYIEVRIEAEEEEETQEVGS